MLIEVIGMNKRQINYESDKMITAQRLKEAMNDAGINLTELSEKSKVSKSSISQYMHGIQSPSNLSSSAIAKVLEVNPVWLMGFDVPKEREAFLESRNARISAYAQYIAKIYDELPNSSKKELKNFAEYLKSKKGG